MTMDPASIARQFHEDGFAIARDIFSKEDLVRMEQELDRFVRDIGPTLTDGEIYYEDQPSKPVKSIYHLNKHSEFFKNLMTDARLNRIVRAIFPEGDLLQFAVSYFAKQAGSGSVTPAHQDNAFQNLIPPEDLVLTIAIDESMPENGPLTVQKGSHKLGRLPHRPSGVKGFSQMLITPVDTVKYPEVQICMKPGDICMHQTNTIHRSDGNPSKHSRRQIGISYRTTRAKRDEEGWKKYQADLKKLHEQHPTETTAR